MTKISVKDLIKAADMTQTEFSKYFGIPLRTVQNWCGGQRQCPDYLLALMDYKLKHEREKVN